MAFSFTLQGKLTVAAGVVAAMIFVGTAVGQWGFSFGVQAERRAFDETLPALDATWALSEQVHALQAADALQREATWRPLEEALARARAFPREGREAELWTELDPALRAWREAPPADRSARGAHANAVVRALLDARRAQSQQSHAAFTRRVSAVRLLVLGSGAVGIIIVVVLGVSSARRISRALDAAVIVINEGTREVEATSVALATDSQALAAGFTQQAHALERTSSAMTQLTAMTHQTAGNAGRARALADDATARRRGAHPRKPGRRPTPDSPVSALPPTLGLP